jgi:hypothetical protein
MEVPKSSTRFILRLLSKGYWRFVLTKVSNRLYSSTKAFGLCRDLKQSFETPEAKIPLKIESNHNRQILELLVLDESLPPDSLWERYRRIRLLQSGLQTCYVALTEDGTPCYIQWLVPHTQSQTIRAFFGTEFPELAVGEALLEGAFIPEAFRGYRIMPCAMSMVAEKGAEIPARYVITFVAADNIPSLKGCIRSGFKPYLLREDRWCFFRHTTQFRPWRESDSFPVPYEL